MSELKKLIKAGGLSLDGVVEKDELIQLAKQATGGDGRGADCKAREERERAAAVAASKAEADRQREQRRGAAPKQAAPSSNSRGEYGDVNGGGGVRHYFECPYSEKDTAKALGAWWDGQEKKWFARPGLNAAQRDALLAWAARLAPVRGGGSSSDGSSTGKRRRVADPDLPEASVAGAAKLLRRNQQG